MNKFYKIIVDLEEAKQSFVDVFVDVVLIAKPQEIEEIKGIKRWVKLSEPVSFFMYNYEFALYEDIFIQRNIVLKIRDSEGNQIGKYQKYKIAGSQQEADEMLDITKQIKIPLVDTGWSDGIKAELYCIFPQRFYIPEAQSNVYKERGILIEKNLYEMIREEFDNRYSSMLYLYVDPIWNSYYRSLVSEYLLNNPDPVKDKRGMYLPYYHIYNNFKNIELIFVYILSEEEEAEIERLLKQLSEKLKAYQYDEFRPFLNLSYLMEIYLSRYNWGIFSKPEEHPYR